MSYSSRNWKTNLNVTVVSSGVFLSLGLVLRTIMYCVLQSKFHRHALVFIMYPRKAWLRTNCEEQCTVERGRFSMNNRAAAAGSRLRPTANFAYLFSPRPKAEAEPTLSTNGHK